MDKKYAKMVTSWQIRKEDFPHEGTIEEKLRFMLGYAILAPSAYNTQPWKFAIADDNIFVFADRSRRLPVVDPDDRELTISVGTAIMNLRIAAAHFGFSTEVHHLPESEDPDLLAKIHLIATNQPQADLLELFPMIPKRRTDRSAYEERPIIDSDLEALKVVGTYNGAGVLIITDAGVKAKLGELAAEGDRILSADKVFRKELSAWVRPNWTKKGDGTPCGAFGIPTIISGMGPFITRTFNMGKIAGKVDRKKISKAEAVTVVYSEKDSPQGWLAAGEAFERFVLTAATKGIHHTLLNMPCEVNHLRSKVREILGISGWPHLLVIIGYSNKQLSPTPRRPVDDMLITI